MAGGGGGQENSKGFHEQNSYSVATLYVPHFCRLQACSQVFFYGEMPSNK